jgi:hypothetical protein
MADEKVDLKDSKRVAWKVDGKESLKVDEMVLLSKVEGWVGSMENTAVASTAVL